MLEGRRGLAMSEPVFEGPDAVRRGNLPSGAILRNPGQVRQAPFHDRGSKYVGRRGYESTGVPHGTNGSHGSLRPAMAPARRETEALTASASGLAAHPRR
jgi:hypothetical protein